MAQKSFKQVLLVPESDFLGYPLVVVVPGRKDVVKMDDYAGCQQREYFENFGEHVALGPDDVRGVNEQDIAPMKFAEHGFINVLKTLSEYLPSAFLKPRLFVWFNANM
jgi:hypothetical protein